MEGVHALQIAEAPRPADALLITRTDLQRFIVHLRECDVKLVSCNLLLTVNGKGRKERKRAVLD